jgi:hypothetical protein
MQYFDVNEVITNLKAKKKFKMEIKSYETNWKNVLNIILYLDHVENLTFLGSLISLYMGVFKL